MLNILAIALRKTTFVLKKIGKWIIEYNINLISFDIMPSKIDKREKMDEYGWKEKMDERRRLVMKNYEICLTLKGKKNEALNIGLLLHPATANLLH